MNLGASSEVQRLKRQGYIYLPKDDSPAILLVQYRVEHFIYDDTETILLCGWRDPVVLARGARFVLQQFTVKPKAEQEIGDKEDDDPAFRASRYGSYTEYEKAYCPVQISVEGELEPVFKAYAFIQKPEEVLLGDSINASAPDAEIGRKILGVYDDWINWTKSPDSA